MRRLDRKLSYLRFFLICLRNSKVWRYVFHNVIIFQTLKSKYTYFKQHIKFITVNLKHRWAYLS